MSSSCSSGADPRRSMKPLSKLPTSCSQSETAGSPLLGFNSPLPLWMPMTADCMAERWVARRVW